jgi:trk system potassium uptake protein TrkH
VAITTLIASLNGVDLLTSFTSGLALVGNVGPGFGKVGPTGNYGFYSSATKLWFSFAMLAGRLELYTIFIFLTPHFWKR